MPGVSGTDFPLARPGAKIRALLDVTVEEQLKIKGQYGTQAMGGCPPWSGANFSQRKLKDPTIRAFRTG